jgi:hypothetical protein
MAGRSYLRLLSSRRSRHRLPGPKPLTDGATYWCCAVHGKAGEPMLAEHGYAVAGSDPALGRIALAAVAIAVAGAFTLLQIRARSRRPAARRAAMDTVRQPALGARRRPILGHRRRARAGRDWRTLPPPYSASAPDERPLRDHDDYGPLWRYGSPRGYGRDYGPGHRPTYAPGYRPDDAPGSQAPYEEPRDWGS